MSKGFVTIATGADNFYKIAANLLRSYRYFTEDPYPFAIICDRTNEYTELFDKIIIMEDPDRSYADKLRLPDYLPFDETIFIDADCLVYKDINCFWEAFAGADDFSAFGQNFPLDYPYGWFKREDAGSYKDRVNYIPDFIGGVYYLRKTENLEQFSEIVKDIAATYHDYTFRQVREIADEPVYALAIAVSNFKTVDENTPDICFYPHNTFFESDITKGKVKYKSRYMESRGLIPEAYMVHWGSGNTRQYTYLAEAYRLNRICSGKPVGKAGLKTAELMIKTNLLARRIYRKAKRLLFERNH